MNIGTLDPNATNTCETATINEPTGEITTNEKICAANDIAESAETRGVATTDTQKENIPYSLAARRAGLNVSVTGTPIINGSSDAIAYNNQLDIIKNVSINISCPDAYRYSQNNNSYGFNYPLMRCAAYALATAKSIINGQLITPANLITDDGYISSWAANGAFRKYTTADASYLAICAQLSMGKPALIYVKNSSTEKEHWATVVARVNGVYYIIDPWRGNRTELANMQVYKDGGATVSGYAIIGFEY